MMQWAVVDALDASVDVDAYRRNRDVFCSGLSEMGYEITKPGGAFYLFPRSPLEDELQFLALLRFCNAATVSHGIGTKYGSQSELWPDAVVAREPRNSPVFSVCELYRRQLCCRRHAPHTEPLRESLCIH
jgi:hypothetical protein